MMDFDVGKMFRDGGFQIRQTDRLQAHVGVVKISHRRLDEKNLSLHPELYPICSC
jgi:hypothetical protein